MPADPYRTYFKGVKSSIGVGTEFTHRTSFENLLNEIKPDNDINIIQEPQKDGEISGRPDFKIEKNGLVIGYIETKKVNRNLDEIIDGEAGRASKQLENYLLSPNLILTNYHEFILFKDGQPVNRVPFFYPSMDKSLNNSNRTNLSRLFGDFFSSTPETITDPERLSILLADKSIRFKEELIDLKEKNSETKYFRRLLGTGGLYDIIKDTLIDELSLDDFIDAYAQTITYGLFLAKLNTDNLINVEDALSYIPRSLGIIRQLFKTIDIGDIPDDISWIIKQIIFDLNQIDHAVFNKKLSFSDIDFEKDDPYVYFYEDFLEEYDKKKKKDRGVYYTPRAIVRFIVNSIDYLIKENFYDEGLKAKDIKVLDFATGTGTFILEAFKKTLNDTDKGQINGLIRERLLKNFYGFEYLIAPYTVAHLKLSEFLKEKGYEFKGPEKVKILLTDTLDDSAHKDMAYFESMSYEGAEAQKIKLEEDILVVMGNPPYSNYKTGLDEKEGHRWLQKLLEDYKKGLDETKINMDDDYIKFIRYAQWKIDENEKGGIIGIITNNSYLDTKTRRIMRKSLLESFDKIYILNLHGHAGIDRDDKNVFGIKQGVTISLFLKLPERIDEKKIYYYSTLEHGLTDKNLKFMVLNVDDAFKTLDWKEIEPKEPDYWFYDKDLTSEDEYKNGWKLTSIFKEYGSGIKTERDKITIHYSEEGLKEVISDFIDLNEQDIAIRYETHDSRDWKISKAKEDLTKNYPVYGDELIRTIQYRPFDYRKVYYTGTSRGFIGTPQKKIANNFIHDNLGLVASKQIVSDQWKHTFITDKITESSYLSTKTREWAYVFPLFIYKEMGGRPNFTLEFFKFISKVYPNRPSPKAILGYIYSILHSTTYREKYYELLKTDFPKIPFTTDFKRFKLLSKLGTDLIYTHLLEHTYPNSKLAIYEIDGDNRVDKIKYDEDNSRLYINKEQYFENVPNEVWNIKIGGYNVLDKWLKYRKKDGIKLSYDDIGHLQKVIRALHESLSIIAEIDQVYKKIIDSS